MTGWSSGSYASSRENFQNDGWSMNIVAYRVPRAQREPTWLIERIPREKFYVTQMSRFNEKTRKK